MTALSAGTDDIVVQIGVTIAAPVTISTSAGNYANQSVTYNKLQCKWNIAWNS